MSVAYEFAPEVYVPDRARRRRPVAPERLATVTVLHRPSARSVAQPSRLTRRGVAVVSVLVGLAAGVLVAVAWLSAPPAASVSTAPHTAPARVVVESGDSLWSIASRVAPDRDPRAEVADLVRLNDLAGAQVQPGLVLRTR